MFSRRFDEGPKRCPLVKEESDLTDSDEEDKTDRRIANLIDFFFTIVKSQRSEDHRKGSGGSCFKSETSPQEEVKTYVPKVNKELEEKMETLMDFLATTGCMSKDDDVTRDDKKITLMEFLFGPDDRKEVKPTVEINLERVHMSGLSLSESNINVKDLSYIDESPGEEGNETLVEMLIKYMEDYTNVDKYKEPTKSMSLTPSLSEKSKSDITISRLETFSDISKTKSDSSLTRTIDTVIDRYEDFRSEKSPSSRRISETVVDLSHVKEDLESIFEAASVKICELRNISVKNYDDTMSEQEDRENFDAYTQPPLHYLQYLPYSFELSDIMEEEEPSSRDFERKSSKDERVYVATRLAKELIKDIEERIQTYPFDESDSSEESGREFDNLSLKRSSISLIDLRNIPDLPPSMIIKPKVVKMDKSTSTTEITDSISDMSKRIDSACMTDDTTLTSSSSERTERAFEKMESLTKFFSKSRLEIINETLEENGEKKGPKVVNSSSSSESKLPEAKAGQASLDDVEDLVDDNDKFDGDGDDDGCHDQVSV